MKGLIQRDDAKTILDPHLPILQKIMAEALEELNQGFSQFTDKVNSRAKCAVLHSLAIEKCKRYFDNVPDIIIKQKYQSIQIVFNQKVVGRIKKINNNLFSSNAKTIRNTHILTHQLPVFPDLQLTFVDLGYNIDPTWTGFEKLAVVCRFEDTIEWDINFTESEIPQTLKVEQTDVLTPKEEKQIKIKKANGTD